MGPRRTAALAAWFQGLYPDPAESAVLVGGGATELWTGGGYTTGDLDFVGSTPAAVMARLKAAGFERRGRHWVHEESEIFIEIPGRALEPPSQPIWLQTQAGRVLIISREALLADRLAAWKFWSSSIDAINALLLVQSRKGELNGRLAARLARELGVDDERRRLMRFAKRLAGRSPTSEGFQRWLDGRRRTR